MLRTINKKCFSHVASPGTLSNEDGDINENSKKAIGLDWQNNNFARASRVFVHFFAVIAQLGREPSQLISRFMEDVNTSKHKTKIFYFLR